MSYKILHYINQFFAGIGGEDKADYAPEIRDLAVGPGIQLAKLFDGTAEITATFICGDNYFATHEQTVLDLFQKALDTYKPDLIIAGPSFYAGRYGYACGQIITEAQRYAGINGIAGMSVENPAVKMFHKDIYIIRTGDSVKYMQPALSDIASLALKLLTKCDLGPADKENYFSRDIRQNFFEKENGGQRAVKMLLKKMKQEPFVSEYLQSIPDKVPIAPALSDLSKATIALLNTGGIVPRGNPDHIESSSATKYGRYPINGALKLIPGDTVSIHGGYDTTFANDNPNRIVPLDVLNELAQDGIINKVDGYYYSTVGTGASLVNAEKFGKAIAQQLIQDNVDGAIMVST